MDNPASKEKLLEELNALEPTEAKEALVKIYEHYLNPAFGALPKRESEIIMFQVLQDLKVFDKNPDQYSLVSSLRITRSKARGLIYESNLRSTDENDLQLELIEILSSPIFLKNDDKVCLEIDNPLLIDHLKHTLKRLKHITDGSFSPDIVKLTPDAFKALLNDQFAKVSKKELNEALIACGAKKKVTVGTLLTGVLKKIGKKVADNAGDQAAEYVGDYLGDLFSKGLDGANKFISGIIDGEAKLTKE